jgi:hypothetical protein
MGLKLLSYFDLLVLVLALPVFIVGGIPMAGYATGAGIWVVQRGIQEYANRKAKATNDPRKVVGIAAGSMIGRGWLVALTILGAYFAAGSDDRVGLSAAVLVIVLFTAYFTVSMILRPFQQNHPEQPV